MYTGNSYLMKDGTEKVINCQKGEGKDGYGVTSDCTATGYYLKKWWDNTYRATLLSGLNPILIRFADVLLMNADRKSTRLNSSHANISYAVFCLKKKNKDRT